VIVRENTEGLYSGIEHMVVPGVAESLKIVTERACQRIAEYCVRHARATWAGARSRRSTRPTS
jgi:isocitrate dehydrogenase (NAD+)